MIRQQWTAFASAFFQGFGTAYLFEGPSIPGSPVKVLDDEDEAEDTPSGAEVNGRLFDLDVAAISPNSVLELRIAKIEEQLLNLRVPKYEYVPEEIEHHRKQPSSESVELRSSKP